MASPFKLFRKHQKVMLAAVAVMAMIGFVILPAIMQTMGQPQQTTTTVVATTTEYGDLQRQQLAVLRWQRQTAIRFMEGLARQLVLAEGNPMAIQTAFHYMAPSGNVSPTSDDALVEKWLLAKRAEELGLAVNDETITRFIIDLSQGAVSGDEIKKLLDAIGVSEDELFSALREELMVIRLRRMFSLSLRGAPTPFSLDGFPTTTPAQRWDYFQRLNRRVTIESVALPVENFVDGVRDPDESTLRAFFEEHKGRLPDPTSPEPGFREPEKVAVEYLKAEYEALFEPEVEAVPEEEVAKYYEEHKEEYKQEELPGDADEEPSPAESEADAEKKEGADSEAPTDVEEPTDEAAEAAMPAEGESPAEEGMPAAAAPPEKTTDEEEPADEEKPADEAAPAEEKPSGAEEAPADEAKAADEETSSDEEKPAEENMSDAEEAPAEEAKADDNEAPADSATPAEPEPDTEPAPEATDSGDETSAVDGASPFRLASLRQEDEAEEEAPGEETPTAESPAAEPEESRDEPEPETAEKADASEDAPRAGEPPADAPVPAAAAPEEPVPPKYLPLEKVESEIRRALARDRVNARIDDAFNRVQELMRRYRNERLLHEAGEGEGPPPEPDLSEAFSLLLIDGSGKVTRDFVADGEGRKLLTRSKTGLISAIEAAGIDLGQSIVENRTPFAAFAYGRNWSAYQPTQSVDSDGNRYVFWKLDDAEERTPEFLDDKEVEELEAKVKELEAEVKELEEEAKRLESRDKKEAEAKRLESRGKTDEAAQISEEAATKRQLRQDVLDEWKKIQAREKAIERAGQLADEARLSKKSLAEAFADQPDLTVTASEPFSWVTYGNIPPMWAQGPPSLSEIEGVEMPGNDFMRAVFRLEKGEIATALNQPQTAAYVVRLTDSNPLPDVLWRMFLAESYLRYFRVASPDVYEAEKDWIEDIKSEAGFAWHPKWEREPGVVR